METQVALHCLFGFGHGSERWRKKTRGDPRVASVSSVDWKHATQEIRNTTSLRATRIVNHGFTQ